MSWREKDFDRFTWAPVEFDIPTEYLVRIRIWGVKGTSVYKHFHVPSTNLGDLNMHSHFKTEDVAIPQFISHTRQAGFMEVE